MPSTYTKIMFSNAIQGGITAQKLNLLVDDLSAAIAAGGGGTGTGDMTKAVYDTNNNGKVDTCDAVPWGSVTGKPTIGDMTKAVYDVNGDGITDHAALADAAPWTGITGKPATFPPDSTAMLKSVYDTNADNIVDHAALADTAPWAGISGKPTTFAPNAHEASHVTGTDQIPNADTTVRGLMPQANGNANAFYSSDGTQKQVSYTMLSGSQPGPITHGASHISTDAVPDATTSVHGLCPPFDGTTIVLTGGKLSAPASGTISGGTWTNLTPATGWSAGAITPQYRIETIGAISTVYLRGLITQGAGAAALAFNLPAAARPGAARRTVVAGDQAADGPDLVLYAVTVAVSGDVNIYAMVKHCFVWPIEADSQNVYLDGVVFSL